MSDEVYLVVRARFAERCYLTRMSAMMMMMQMKWMTRPEQHHPHLRYLLSVKTLMKKRETRIET